MLFGRYVVQAFLLWCLFYYKKQNSIGKKTNSKLRLLQKPPFKNYSLIAEPCISFPFKTVLIELLIFKLLKMDYTCSHTFIETLKSQIKDELNNYRSALNSNKGYLELKQIKEKIQKLQRTMDLIMNNVGNYALQDSAAILDR